jgi:riboflavin biosynthesis pyrimidine reductase
MIVTHMMAATVNGKIALTAGEGDETRAREGGFDSQKDRELLLGAIRESQAVVLGAGTALAPGGIIDLGVSPQPTWYALSRKGSNPSLPSPGMWLIPPAHLSDDEMPIYVLKHLSSLGLSKILLLGGAQISRLFYRARCVHRLKLTLAPVLYPEGALSFFSEGNLPLQTLQLLNLTRDGDHVFLEYGIL